MRHLRKKRNGVALRVHCIRWKLIGCLHDRANIEQLAGRSMVISMLIRRADGL